MELNIHRFYDICKRIEWIRNDLYYVEEILMFLVSEWCKRSIDYKDLQEVLGETDGTLLVK